MRNKLPYIVTAAVLLGIAMLAFYGQETVQGSDERGQLSFQVQALNKKVLPLETIALRFTVSNRSEGTLKFHGTESLEGIRLEIQRPSGEATFAEQLSPFVRTIASSERVLEPGHSSSWDEKLEYKLNDYFGEVGSYRIRATFDNRDGETLTSDWETLIVEKPTGQDLAAYKKLKSIPQFRDGKFSVGFDRESNQIAFIEQFPNSRYADYYRLKVAEGLENNDRDRALELYESVAEKSDFIFAEIARGKVKEIREEKEKDEKRKAMKKN